MVQEGKFIWDATGGVVSSGYTNWVSGEPNDAGGNEDCIHIGVYAEYGKAWNDLICGKLLYAICENQP